MSIYMFYGLLCLVMLSVLQGVISNQRMMALLLTTITTMAIGAGGNDKYTGGIYTISVSERISMLPQRESQAAWICSLNNPRLRDWYGRSVLGRLVSRIDCRLK